MSIPKRPQRAYVGKKVESTTPYPVMIGKTVLGYYPDYLQATAVANEHNLGLGGTR